MTSVAHHVGTKAQPCIAHSLRPNFIKGSVSLTYTVSFDLTPRDMSSQRTDDRRNNSTGANTASKGLGD